VAAARAGELSVNGGCMAILIPSLGFARFDTRGELRLAERLKDFLEENAVVWHNLPVGPRSRHPDFIIVHPANGLLERIPLDFTHSLSLTLANFEWAHLPRGTRNIGSFSTIS